MDNNYEPNINTDGWEYSLEAILAEYASAPETPCTPEEQRSREIVMEALGEQIAFAADSTDFPEETAQIKPRRSLLHQSRKAAAPEEADEFPAPEEPDEFSMAEETPEAETPEASAPAYMPEPEPEAAPEPEVIPVPESEPEYSLTDIVAEVKAADRAAQAARERAAEERRAREAQLKAAVRAAQAKAAAEANAVRVDEAAAQIAAAIEAAAEIPEGSSVTVEITAPAQEIAAEAVTAPAQETAAEAITDDTGEVYAAADYPEWEDAEAETAEAAPRADTKRPNPLVMALAALLIRRRQHAQKVRAEDAEEEAERESMPEVSVKTAAKYYIKNATPYKLRFMAAAILCLILLYVSWGLPLVGAMKSIRVCAGMCMLLELSVMLLGLDVFTNGMTALFRGKPGLTSLVSVSCIFSVLDAAIILLGGPKRGLPYCAVSAVSMTLALLGERYYCLGMARGFHTAAAVAEPTAVSSEAGALPEGRVLIKGGWGAAGFVGRSEDTDPVTAAYAGVAPILLAAAPVLAFIATVCRKQAGDFFHCLSALTAVSTSFSALLCYTLPFAVTAKRLSAVGAALAGWSGAADIGESRRTVVTDGDLFPEGNVLIDTVRILEGVHTDKVISYAGSVVAYSGCGLVPAFTDLMKRNGCAIHPVENFSCHRGGGLTAIVRGEQVFVGNSSFMNLMGIRLPQSQMSKTSVFVAISGELVGVFAIRYVPTAAVQSGLVELLGSRSGAPLFAIRDFNVTPLLLKQRFRMPTEGFEFPSFPERYRISALTPKDAEQPAALLVRKGLLPYVEAAAAGRSLYRSVRVCLLLSLVCSVLGMLLMFFLCAGASYDSASVGNILLFMLFWLVPVVISALGLRR